MSSITDFSLKIRQKLSEIYDFTIGWFISSLFKKPASVLFLGIDNAGKTTLVYKLKNNANNAFLPTRHSTKDIVEIGNLKALIFDIGGHRTARQAWKDYFHGVDGVVFIIDCSDTARFNEVAEAWASVRQMDREAPILVLVNKIDLLGVDATSARSHPQLQEMLGMAGIFPSSQGQCIELFYLSIVNENVFDKNSVLCSAFAWLSKCIDERSKKKQ
ncbi:GTP-binding protein SAR1 [Pancytospora philotis]|nr:GTP-binding protein SAR1 [Pancytospora philotis]